MTTIDENGIAPDYAGFWRRVAATLIDTLLLMLVFIPIALAVGLFVTGGTSFDSNDLPQPWNFLVNVLMPAAIIILFWMHKSGTPGKLAMGVCVVDAATGRPLGAVPCIVRYLGYYLSGIVLLLGFIWVAFDKRKQGWHDKLANSLVVHKHSVAHLQVDDVTPV